MKTNKKIDELVNELGKEEILNYLSNSNKSLDYRDIKTYEDAVIARPVDIDDIIYSTDSKYIIGLKKLVHIYKAINKLNNNWVPDFNDLNQYKYYPYFKLSGSGFGFSVASYFYDGTITSVGVRLCTYSREVAEYIGKTFIKEYEDYLL